MRRGLLVVVALLAAAFLIFSLAELQNVLDALAKANPAYLAAAALLELAALGNLTATFAALYRLVGLQENGRRLFLMTTAANFVNVVAPSAGVGGIAVFLEGARQRRIAAGRIIVIGVLYLLYEYAALLSFVGAGLVALRQRGVLNAGELVAAGLLLALALAVAALLALGSRSSHRLDQVLALLARLANAGLRPFLRRDYVSLAAAHGFARDMAEGLQALRGSRASLFWPLFFSLTHKILLLGVLALAFLALDTPVTLSTLVGGFGVTYLFFVVSPTPSGLGFVEGVLPAALHSLGVALPQAVLITLAFRAVTFWLPLAVGALAFRRLHRAAPAPAGDD